MNLTTDIIVDGLGAEAERSKRNISGTTGGLGALPVLWHFTVSHFNEKVRWALDFKRIPHVRRALLPGFHFRKVWSMTGQTAVPVLVLDGRPINDSTRIIAALERAYPELPLYPRNEPERRRALELEDFFDKEVGPSVRAMLVHAQFVHNPELTAALFTVGMGRGSRRTLGILSPVFRRLYRFRYKINAASAEVAREKTMAALDRIERELQPERLPRRRRFQRRRSDRRRPFVSVRSAAGVPVSMASPAAGVARRVPRLARRARRLSVARANVQTPPRNVRGGRSVSEGGRWDDTSDGC